MELETLPSCDMCQIESEPSEICQMIDMEPEYGKITLVNTLSLRKKK